MGSCTKRHFLLSICILQLVSTVERQVFDFLGYMWAPILVNFFNIIFVIFGFFGAYQYRPKYIITYSIWNMLWIAWNAFVICFYLDVGVLNKDRSDILNLGTGSVSWWEINGYGCSPIFATNITNEDFISPFRPVSVEGCLLEYTHVEIIHAGLQCVLAFLGLIGGICLGHVLLEEDDSFDFMGGDGKSPHHLALHPMYVSQTNIAPKHNQINTKMHRTDCKYDNRSQEINDLSLSHNSDCSTQSFQRINLYHKEINPLRAVRYSNVNRLPSDHYDFCSNTSPTTNLLNIKRKSGFHADKIRVPNNDRPNMVKAKSQEKLSYRNRSKNISNKSRPKSLCTNNNFVEH